MFFKTKRNPGKTTHQTLSTEQLEPKAMFSVSPVEPVVALDVGPVNQAGYDCQGAGTCSADGFMKIGDIKGEVKPTERVGEDGRMIVHPQYNVGGSAHPGGDDVFMPKPNRTDVWTNGSATSLAPFTTGEGGDSIVHPQFNVGEETLPTGTIISYEDSHLSAKDLIGRPPEPKIAPPAPHVSDRAAVIDGGSDSYTEVEWTYFASRQEVFARMGR